MNRLWVQIELNVSHTPVYKPAINYHQWTFSQLFSQMKYVYHVQAITVSTISFLNNICQFCTRNRWVNIIE